MTTRLESALVVVLDDAGPFEQVRRSFAPKTVARGIPFHITLLYPFAPADELTDDLIDDVRVFFAGTRPFAFALTRIACWPGVVYAVPEPDERLRRCTLALVDRFPAWPPYGGAHEDVIPHATLGEGDDAVSLEREIEQQLAPHLPRRYFVEEATLLAEVKPGRWRERQRFALEG